MKRRDEGKTSLVEFLRSIKYANHARPADGDKTPSRFADFRPRVRGGKNANAEELSLVRSVN